MSDLNPTVQALIFRTCNTYGHIGPRCARGSE